MIRFIIMQYTDSKKNLINLGDKERVNQDIQEISRYVKEAAADQIMQNLMEDPSIYAYDDYVDTKKQQKNKESIQKKIQPQKKESQYIGSILEQAQRRKAHQLLTQSRINAKEAAKTNTECYIGEAYKRHLEEAMKYSKVDDLMEKVDKKSKEENKLGILKTLYQQNQFQGGNRDFETKIVDQYKVLESYVEQQEKAAVEKHEEPESAENSPESRDRSRSKEKEAAPPQEPSKGETREEKLRLYKERYLQRKQVDQ